VVARQSLAVLVVEDEPALRETAVNMFKSLGAKVYDAYNGRDALRLLSSHDEIELLFADVRMPGISGVELAIEARRIRPHLRVVLTSGYVGESPLPDEPFLRKPWRLSDIAPLLTARLSPR
jgi:CheY-like chemotaxis protein